MITSLPWLKFFDSPYCPQDKFSTPNSSWSSCACFSIFCVILTTVRVLMDPSFIKKSSLTFVHQGNVLCLLLFYLNYLFRLCWVLVAACGIFSWGIRTLSCSMHAGSSSLTRDQTRAPCIGSTDSYQLDHQGSPLCFLLKCDSDSSFLSHKIDEFILAGKGHVSGGFWVELKEH